MHGILIVYLLLFFFSLFFIGESGDRLTRAAKVLEQLSDQNPVFSKGVIFIGLVCFAIGYWLRKKLMAPPPSPKRSSTVHQVPHHSQLDHPCCSHIPGGCSHAPRG
ncbi:uncharacterized protein LOC112025018 [Quercus suber]|uniref:uncharacterized protein LOC112025018 n=1 Tax=Quercus suber TaxID=58331 RepID=UPI000CE1F948|nr:uncharacterized protein LOC112025018 [Quercus suber]